MGVSLTPGWRPTIVSVRGQSVPSVPNGVATECVISLPAAQPMPTANYSVVVSISEFSDRVGSAIFEILETRVVSATQFAIRVRHSWTTPLPFSIDYIAVSNTPQGQPHPDATKVGDVSWKPGAFVAAGGWGNYGEDYQTARYRKLITGEVEVQGLVKGGVIGNSIIELPVGYRPSGRLIFAALTDPNVVGRMDVTASGLVIPMAGASGWFSINCKFYADQ